MPQKPNEVAVTLTPALFRQLSIEARATGIPLEWLVASMVADSIASPDLKALAC